MHVETNDNYPHRWDRRGPIDLKDPAELLEVIAIMVDAMRRSDPEWCASHNEPPCCDEDWDTAMQAGEDALDANQ